ncbi:MAG: hypothetical protein HC887_07530 [Desulfobacteraceae bacterium]|nr:hypothetical protein [Desulfobacteraceae bacterium]
MVKSYFDKILATLYLKKWVESVRIIECDITENDLKHILIYRLRVRMKDDDLLEIMERICFSKKDGQIIPTKYSFHWQDANSKIIRRWDNAPHHPEIQTHPYHVHEDREDNVKPSLPIAALEMLYLIDMEK